MKKKVIIGIVVLGVLGAIVYANFNFKRATGVSLQAEKIEKHDLEAIVSVSGKIQPKKSVNVSAETSGKIVDLSVDEGDRVQKGQFLLQIDPRNLQTQFDRNQGSLEAAQSTLEQTKQSVENSKLTLKQTEDNLRRAEASYKASIISKVEFENAQNAVKQATTNLKSAEQSVLTQETRIKQERANLDSAKIDLNKVRIESPISGIVTRRNIEAGETAMIGTMNNAGTVLLTIADMSVIEAQVEVDETQIPLVKVGQTTKITIDALPDKTFEGRVTEVGNSPIVSNTAQRATNFRVVVTIDGQVPDVRPGFTCQAVITTATRKQVVAMPIQSATIREMIVDEKGAIVRNEAPAGREGGAAPKRALVSTELKPGQTRKELEGVFVVRNGHAVFVPVKTGIAGEKYLEVLEGLAEGDQVVIGPFASVRTLKDGDEVRIEGATPAPAGAK